MADIGQYQQSAFSVPVSGAAATAAGVRANDNAVATKHNSHDNDHTIHVLSFANLAAFTAASSRSGATAVALDTKKLYISDGTNWNEIGYRPSATALTAADITAGTFPSGTFTFQAGLTVTGAKTTLAATASGYASLNLPHGTAPSSPSNGDVWTTTSGLLARINGATVGPFLGSGGDASLSTLALTGTGPVIDASSGIFTSTPAIKFPSAADVVVSLRSGSGSFASGGSTTISWSVENADTKSLSSVGGGATTTAFNTGAYGGLWLVTVTFSNLYSTGSETGQVTVTGALGGTGAGAGDMLPGSASGNGANTYTFVCRIADSTAVTVTAASSGGTNGINWSRVTLTAVRIY